MFTTVAGVVTVAVGPPLNQITVVTLPGGAMQLSYYGSAGAAYALERTFSLTPPPIAWLPQVTNIAAGNGAITFTNTPVPTTNNFWRIRSVP